MAECIDARGLPWPQPWTLVQEAMAGATHIHLFVDGVWVDAIRAEAERVGWRVLAEETVEGWFLSLSV